MIGRRVIVLGLLVASSLLLFVCYHTLTAGQILSEQKPVQQGPTVELRYRTNTSTNNLVAESAFRFSNTTLRQYGFPIQFTADSKDSESLEFDMGSLVFVTAANSDRLHVDMDAIAIVQTLFPDNIIYFYDLDEGTSNIVAEKISQLCNVVYRKFDFTQYPEHISDIFKYAWKPVIIHEVLREHRHVFWMDASIRFKTEVKFSDIVQQATTNNSHLLMFDTSGHSVFSATHSGMYKYLPISKASAAKIWMHGANAIYIQLTQQLYNEVISWWFLCALQHNCMAPTRDLFCTFKGRDVYADCHRYDQSALNILLSNCFGDDDRIYFNRVPNVLGVERGWKHREPVHFCSADGRRLGRTLSKDFLSLPFFDAVLNFFGWQ